MSQVDLTALWDFSPIPQFVMDRAAIRQMNGACLALLGYEYDELVGVEGWEEFLFANATQSYKFFSFVFEGRRNHMDVEFRSREKVRLYLRVERKLILPDEDMYLVALTDLTEIREDSEAMQAGYDEFVKVTTELEGALNTIEKQNALLEKQQQTLQNELNLARTVQNQLFTRDFSEFRRMRVSGFYEAMENLGGDMWEFYETPGEFLAVIGDVMGHGVAAGLISIAAKTLFKKHFEVLSRPEASRDLGQMCTALNLELLEITQGNYYITICLVRVDSENRMYYLTCGHPPLFLVREGARHGKLLYTSQPMLGVFPEVVYESQSVQLRARDRVLMYTDCLLESFNPEGNPLDLQNVTAMIRYAPDTTPEHVVDRVLDYRQQFSGSASLPDDLAVLCIEVPADSEIAAVSQDSVTPRRP
ncbi:MAG: PP2C family protein-serine/threonine phosphatase [Leptospirales bacterium]|jgi:sigma-B regulation protein RsbU (phosphoserine phosphatase)